MADGLCNGQDDDGDLDQGQDNVVTEDLQEEPTQSVLVSRRAGRQVCGVRKPQPYRAFHTSVRKGLQQHGDDAYAAIVAELIQLLRDKKAMTPVKRGDGKAVVCCQEIACGYSVDCGCSVYSRERAE